MYHQETIYKNKKNYWSKSKSRTQLHVPTTKYACHMRQQQRKKKETITWDFYILHTSLHCVVEDGEILIYWKGYVCWLYSSCFVECIFSNHRFNISRYWILYFFIIVGNPFSITENILSVIAGILKGFIILLSEKIGLHNILLKKSFFCRAFWWILEN